MKIAAITGATGLIGRSLCKKLHNEGFELVIFGRDTERSRKIIPWAERHYRAVYGYEDYLEGIDGADVVINLAGASIGGKRWSESYKEEILSSRVKTTRAIAKAAEKVINKPGMLLSASAVGYYGDRDSELLTEQSASGDGFLAEVCRIWEQEALSARGFGRVVTARIGVVLSKNGGALSKMTAPYKLYVGGPIGTGKQWMSWIHIRDLVEMFCWIINKAELKGPVNCVSPGAVQMKEFGSVLGRVMNKPSLFRVPSLMMKLMLGEASEMVLNSSRVLPGKAEELGFGFEFANLEDALHDILRK